MEHTAINQAPGKPFPDEQDYHGHPNYARIFFLLLLLLGVSLAVGYFTSPMLGVCLIFLTAFIKAGMVVVNFMHLKFEPALIAVVVGVVVFVLLSFFWGVFPDVTLIERSVVK